MTHALRVLGNGPASSPRTYPGIAAEFPRPWAIWDPNQVIFVAMHNRECCYANKPVVTGIWYT